MLENSVSDYAVVVIFYTKGYFQSKNCRRDVYAVVEKNKPTLVLYDGKDGIVDSIHMECAKYYTVTPDPDTVLL